MKKTELHELIKSELNHIKEHQAFANLDEATENIATDIFTDEDWDNPNAQVYNFVTNNPEKIKDRIMNTSVPYGFNDIGGGLLW